MLRPPKMCMPKRGTSKHRTITSECSPRVQSTQTWRVHSYTTRLLEDENFNQRSLHMRELAEIHSYLNTCINCIHTYVPTYLPTCLNSYLHTYRHTCIYRFTCFRIHTHTWPYTYICGHMCVYIYICLFIQMHLPVSQVLGGRRYQAPYVNLSRLF